MKRRYRVIPALSILLTTVLAASGCQSSGTAAKQAALSALDAGSKITSDTFQGSASFQLPEAAAATNGGMVASGLSHLLKTSAYAWKGVQSTNPVHLEADVTVTPQGSTDGIDIPVLIKDSKMYFRIPAINQDDEYFVIDSTKSDSPSAGLLSPDKLQSSSGTISGVLRTLLSAVDDRAFSESAKDDETGNTTVQVAVTQKNIADIAAAIYPKLPDVIDQLSAGGLISAAQADQWKAAFAADKADSWTEQTKRITVVNPGSLKLVIDAQGFVSSESINLDLTVKQGAQDVPVKLALSQSLDKINANPPFTREVPAHVRDFSEILQQLKPAGTAATK